MSRISKSFSTRLSLNIVSINSVLFIVAIAIAAVSSHILIVEEATKSAENILHSAILDIEKNLLTVEIPVQESVPAIKEKCHDKKAMYGITERLVKEHPHIIGSAIAFVADYFPGEHFFSPYSCSDGDGRITQMQLGNEDYDYFCMDWYQIPFLLERPYWSEPYFDDGGGEKLMSTYSYPIKDDDGKIFAIVTADISLEWLSEKTVEIKPYENSFMTVVSQNGSYVGANNATNLGGETIFSTAIASNDEKIMEISRYMMEGRDSIMRFSHGKDISFAVFGPVSNGWSAAIICRYREVLERSSKMHLILILVGLFGLLLLFSICYIIIHRQTKPLTDFSNSARKIAHGDFNTELPEIHGEDEIRQLHDSFDYLQKNLAKYIESLKESTAKNERFESELNIARAIQLNMVPHDFPEGRDADVYATLKPAREVGGDFYDFRFFDNDKLYFAIGDVSGKGVPAALIMAIFKYSLRLVINHSGTLASTIKTINNSICENNAQDMFVTLFLGELNLTTGELKYCNGGHNPIVITEPGCEPRFLEQKSNIAVGVWENFEYMDESVMLKKGSRLLLYTDGVTEAERADKEQYGEKKLLDLLARLPADLTAKQTIEVLDSDIHSFTEGNEQNDDITIMAINY